MKVTLGVSVTSKTVRAVCVEAGVIQWVGSKDFSGATDLAEAFSNLTSECPAGPREVRVVLERDVVQLRTVTPAPPLSSGAIARYVDLESPRLFRRNGSPNLVDGRVLEVKGVGRVLWMAGAPSDLVKAVVEGCHLGGLSLEGLGPAAEVLPRCLADLPSDGEVTFSNGSTSEVVSLDRGRTWRSRLVRRGDSGQPVWTPQLLQMEKEASKFAAAFGAAIQAPTLQLLPEETRRTDRNLRRWRIARVALAAALLWIVAGVVYTGRLMTTASVAERGLTQIAVQVDSALTLKRSLFNVRNAIATVATAERERSRMLELLARLTIALGDSVFLESVRVSPDSTLRITGYAKVAAQVLVDLEDVPGLTEVRFETPVVREVLGAGNNRRDWDRFGVVSRHRQQP